MSTMRVIYYLRLILRAASMNFRNFTRRELHNIPRYIRNRQRRLGIQIQMANHKSPDRLFGPQKLALSDGQGAPRHIT